MGTAAPPLVEFVVIGTAAGSAADGTPLGVYFFIEVDGEGIDEARVETPSQGSLELLVQVDGSVASYGDGPYSSLEALKATHREGTYRLTVNDLYVASLAWDPPDLTSDDAQAPSLQTVVPADGSTIFDATPDYSYATNCSNCDGFIELCTFTTDGSGDVAACFESPDSPFPSTVSFDQLENQGGLGPITALPSRPYGYEVFLSGIETEDVDFSPALAAPAFYVAETGIFGTSTYRVPEPTPLIGQAVVIATVSLLARRRLRRRARTQGTRERDSRPLS